MPMLSTQLHRQWPRLVVAALSLKDLFYSIYSIRGSLKTETPTPGMIPDHNHSTEFVIYAIFAVFSTIDLHRLYVAYRPTTGGAQLSFNIWSIGTVLLAFFYLLGELYNFFVPEFMELAKNTTSTADVSGTHSRQNQSLPMLLSEQVTQSTTSLTFVETVWKGVTSWMPIVFHFVLGLALWTILNQRRQLDQEQEHRQEQQGYHLLATNGDLPTPIASASTVNGFKTEAEIRRSRLRVPTWPRLLVGVWFLLVALDGITRIPTSLGSRSALAKLVTMYYLLQSLSGLYILYRKSLVLTQWLFYSICVTTLHMWIDIGTKIWNADLTEVGIPWKELSVEIGETAALNERRIIRGVAIVFEIAFLVVRLWVAWRLVADLKARDARVARAKEQQELRERGLAEKQQTLDDVVTEKAVDQSLN